MIVLVARFDAEFSDNYNALHGRAVNQLARRANKLPPHVIDDIASNTMFAILRDGRKFAGRGDYRPPHALYRYALLGALSDYDRASDEPLALRNRDGSLKGLRENSAHVFGKYDQNALDASGQPCNEDSPLACDRDPIPETVAARLDCLPPFKPRFSPGSENQKMRKLCAYARAHVSTFSVTAGETCPFAKECWAKLIETDSGWTIRDGKHSKYRCFSVSQELLYPAMREQRRYNRELIAVAARSVEAAALLIVENVPRKTEIVRIHIGGDFQTQAYFDAWLRAAELLPNVRFYAYTKSLPFWIKRRDVLPFNFILTASRGGSRDDLIDAYGLREAVVVGTKYEAGKLGLPVDKDDRHACFPRAEGKAGSFALIVHGPQAAGTRYSQIVTRNNRRTADRNRQATPV